MCSGWGDVCTCDLSLLTRNPFLKRKLSDEVKYAPSVVELISLLGEYVYICTRMLGFVTAEEDLRVKTSYPFNEVTSIFLLNNPLYDMYAHMYVEGLVECGCTSGGNFASEDVLCTHG